MKPRYRIIFWESLIQFVNIDNNGERTGKNDYKFQNGSFIKMCDTWFVKSMKPTINEIILEELFKAI